MLGKLLKKIGRRSVVKDVQRKARRSWLTSDMSKSTNAGRANRSATAEMMSARRSLTKGR